MFETTFNFEPCGICGEGPLSSTDDAMAVTLDKGFCMGHASMQRFAQHAPAAKMVGDWLELPEGTHFMGHPCLGSILYVRKAYRLLRLALTRKRSQGFPHVVVNGNPGIGKSWFAMYMLVW